MSLIIKGSAHLTDYLIHPALSASSSGVTFHIEACCPQPDHYLDLHLHWPLLVKGSADSLLIHVIANSYGYTHIVSNRIGYTHNILIIYSLPPSISQSSQLLVFPHTSLINSHLTNLCAVPCAHLEALLVRDNDSINYYLPYKGVIWETRGYLEISKKEYSCMWHPVRTERAISSTGTVMHDARVFSWFTKIYEDWWRNALCVKFLTKVCKLCRYIW